MTGWRNTTVDWVLENNKDQVHIFHRNSLSTVSFSFSALSLCVIISIYTTGFRTETVLSGLMQ